MPRMFYISKIDEENSDYYTSLHKLQKQFGVSVAPIVVPIFEGNRDTVGHCGLRDPQGIPHGRQQAR